MNVVKGSVILAKIKGRCQGCGAPAIKAHPYHGLWCKDCLDVSPLGGNRCSICKTMCKKHCPYCNPEAEGATAVTEGSVILTAAPRSKSDQELIDKHGDEQCNEVEPDLYQFYSDFYKEVNGIRPRQPITVKEVIEWMEQQEGYSSASVKSVIAEMTEAGLTTEAAQVEALTGPRAARLKRLNKFKGAPIYEDDDDDEPEEPKKKLPPITNIAVKDAATKIAEQIKKITAPTILRGKDIDMYYLNGTYTSFVKKDAFTRAEKHLSNKPEEHTKGMKGNYPRYLDEANGMEFYDVSDIFGGDLEKAADDLGKTWSQFYKDNKLQNIEEYEHRLFQPVTPEEFKIFAYDSPVNLDYTFYVAVGYISNEDKPITLVGNGRDVVELGSAYSNKDLAEIIKKDGREKGNNFEFDDLNGKMCTVTIKAGEVKVSDIKPASHGQATGAIRESDEAVKKRLAKTLENNEAYQNNLAKHGLQYGGPSFRAGGKYRLKDNTEAKGKTYTGIVNFDGDIEYIDCIAANEAEARKVINKALDADYEAGGKIVEIKERQGLYK